MRGGGARNDEFIQTLLNGSLTPFGHFSISTPRANFCPPPVSFILPNCSLLSLIIYEDVFCEWLASLSWWCESKYEVLHSDTENKSVWSKQSYSSLLYTTGILEPPPILKYRGEGEGMATFVLCEVKSPSRRSSRLSEVPSRWKMFYVIFLGYFGFFFQCKLSDLAELWVKVGNFLATPSPSQLCSPCTCDLVSHVFVYHLPKFEIMKLAR